MRLYLFELGRVRMDGTPIPGYLVQTDGGANVLIDTGYRPGTFGERDDPSRAFFDVSEDEVITSQLARLGITRDDIDYVVSTHFDPDHCGYTDEFPGAEMIVQRRQLAAARTSGAPRFEFTRRIWDNPALHWREVDDDTALVAGVDLIDTSGHAIGHQSVLVRLPETGPVLLAIDAIPNHELTDPDTRPTSSFDMDEAGTRESTRKLMDLAEREGVSMIIFGHDAEQWKTLRKSPLYYS